MGIEEKILNGYPIKIYNMEKTLCDCIRYRHKMDKNIIAEAFREYIRRKDKNFNLLMKYSEECSIAKIVKLYMEVLI
ncbi:type IV toxin-antitoxin system AbiEi family antitoxin domain-containing protein [Clostridium gasigenes]|uniref:type IV toxin-antitoxin system AbiEi family antitoxin domain-containing protein n=1 Tax=Clostridium gasigenes TaxID=94869 RepID=UPI001C0AF749|nr:hypothetical protein [Clostridium gasigenes]MBU3108071.1 hypothetical protein [Clostridium gasigenes]